jgi:hypothetical protein
LEEWARFLRVIGYQAHRSRSVKTATDGRRYRDTYTNKKRQKIPNKCRATLSAADAQTKFLGYNVRKNNRIKSFVPFDLPPLLASSPPSTPGHRSLAGKIREPLQEANARCGAEVELGVHFI